MTRGRPVPVAERFWTKVNKNGPTLNGMRTPCWLWTASLNSTGRGQIGSNSGGKHVTLYAHRVAYELVRGPIPDGMHVCHHCDNGPCVNPDHLFLGTHADNMADKDMKGRGAKLISPPKAETERHFRSLSGRRSVFSEWADDAGFSLSAIAKAVGVSRQAIDQINRNISNPGSGLALDIEELSFGRVPASSWRKAC